MPEFRPGDRVKLSPKGREVYSRNRDRRGTVVTRRSVSSIVAVQWDGYKTRRSILEEFIVPEGADA